MRNIIIYQLTIWGHKSQAVVVLGSEAEDGSNNWESDSTYFIWHPILFSRLELLELRATSTAGKQMLFCVVKAKKISPFLVFSFLSLLY